MRVRLMAGSHSGGSSRGGSFIWLAWLMGRIGRNGDLVVGIEGAQPASAPACPEIIGAGTISALPQLIRQCEEGTQQGGTIIVHQVDHPGLLHQATEFNQMAGARAPILNPLACIIAGSRLIQPIPLHDHAPELSCCCLKVLQQFRRLWSFSLACRRAERSPAHVRSTS